MVTRHFRSRTISAVLLVVAATSAIVQSEASAQTTSSVETLIATAEHNTNTVRTLVYHDQLTITGPGGSLKVSARGTEDEIRNREQDYESVLVTKRGAGGKVNTLKYTVDLIFLNGSTYYRTSAAPTTWKTHKGMKFPDPYTGGWQRGRTTVKLPSSLVFTVVGTSGGQTHVHASFTTRTTAGTADLWLTTGATPYVVRQNLAYHATKATSASETSRITYGPFNRAVNIQPPAQASA